MIKGIVITIALEILLPVIAGLYFAVRGSEDSDPKTLFLARAYTSGQILLFALFQQHVNRRAGGIRHVDGGSF